MIARFQPSPQQVAAACFPVPGCTVAGYAHKGGYCLTVSTPAGFAGPRQYSGHGRTCYEALAAAVQLFHDSAHAFPSARPLATPGSYAPPQRVRPFPYDDEPEDDEPETEWYDEHPEDEAICQYEMRLAHRQAQDNY